MTAPRTFTEYASTIPDPAKAKKADIWDAIYAANPTWSQSQLDRAADERYALESRGQTPKDYKPGAANALLHGLTFGTSDEILGAASAVGDRLGGNRRPLSELYGGRVGEERSRLRQARDESPVSSTIADVAGSVYSGGTVAKLGLAALRGVNLARAAAPTTMLGKVGLGAAGGAAGGAASGYADAEGGVEGRAAGAARGAAFGAAAGGALPLIGAGIRHLRDAFGLRRAGQTTLDAVTSPAAADAVPDDAPRSLFRDTPRTQPVPVDPSPALRSRIAQIVAAVRRETPSSPTAAGRADEKVLDALTARGQTLDQVESAVRSASGRGKPVALVDVGGEPLRRLTRGARAVRSDLIDERLGTRAAAAPERVVGDIETVVGTQRGIPQELEAMIAERSAEANRLYPAARTAGIEVRPESAEQVALLRRVLARKPFRDAYAQAQELAELKGDPLPDIYGVGADGATTLNTIPDVRGLDYLKRGVDAVIEKGNGGAGLSREMAKELRNELRGVLGVYDELVPEYGAARRAFAGRSELIDAYRAAVDGVDGAAGTLSIPNFTKASADEVQSAVSRMTDGELEAYRKGAVAALKRMEQNVGDGGDRVKRLFGTPAMRAKLRTIFPDDATFDSLQARMGDEKAMRESFDFVRGNSQTVDKAIDASDASDLAQIAASAPKGVTALLGSVVSAGQRRLLQGQSRAIAETIGDRATLGIRSNNASMDEILTYLQQLRALQASRTTVGARRAAAGGAAAGAQAGSASARQ